MDDTVKMVIDASVEQGEYLTSLATAIIGGSIALIVWVAKEGSGLGMGKLRYWPAVAIAVICMSLSLISYYVASGLLITNMPALALVDLEEETKPKEINIEGHSAACVTAELERRADSIRKKINDAGMYYAQVAFAAQLIFFGIGVFSILVFALRNASLLSGHATVGAPLLPLLVPAQDVKQSDPPKAPPHQR